MADYDVSVVELTTPAATAPLAQMRPVVSVRNNGIHDAVASGYIRIYSAGLLIFESEIYSDTIGPGVTGAASAVDYWTPPAEGSYMVQGYLSTPLDQVEPNNNLSPTWVAISGEPPIPPGPVEFHASQHEEDGGDELSIEGLRGRTGDTQIPIAHASFHEINGEDVLNVQSLPGILSEPQYGKSHAAEHKIGGSDLLSVLTLPDNTDLERVARKGANNGYAALDFAGHVPDDQLAAVAEPIPDAGDALTFASGWSRANPLPHAHLHEDGATDEISVEGLSGVLADPQPTETLNSVDAFTALAFDDPETVLASLTVPAVWMNSSLGVVLNLAGRLETQLSAGAVLRLKVKLGAAIICQHDIDVNKNSIAPASAHAIVAAIDGYNVKAFIEFFADTDAVQHLGIHVATCQAGTNYATAETVFTITGQFINGAAAHQWLVDLAHCWNTGQQT